jgi:hypothetical protein
MTTLKITRVGNSAGGRLEEDELASWLDANLAPA